MKFKWETDEERLRRQMRIPAKKKLEWLRLMQETLAQSSPRKRMALRRKLRKSK